MRLKIADDFLDGDESIIAQTYAVNEIGDLKTRQGGFSNDFTIPLTGKNKGILGLPNDINSASRNPYTRIAATLFERGAPVAFGSLKYQVVNEKILQASFFSDNSEWFALIKDKKLTDLDLTDFNHTYDHTTIGAAINADKSSGYTYPLIDYGEFGSAAPSPNLKVTVEQMFPALFLHSLVSKIFFDAGWKVDGELIDNPDYLRRIVPFSAKAFNHDSIWLDDNVYSDSGVSFAFGNPGTEVTWTTAASVDINVSTAGLEAGLYTIKVTANVTSGATDSFAFQIEKNGGSIAVLGFITTPVSVETFTLTIEDVALDPATPDLISVLFQMFTMGQVGTVNSVNIEINGQPPVKENSTVQMSAIMPDMKQSDLLKYVAFSFGAILQANTLSKTVTWSFFRSLKDNIGNGVDWSAKLDRSKPADINFSHLLNNYAKNSVINYKEDDNDEELSAYKAETEQNFGQGQFDIDNEFISEIKTIYEAPFTPMININTFTNTIYIPQIRYLTSGGALDKEPKAKIGILSKNIDVGLLTNDNYATFEVSNEADDASTTATEIPFCWFAKTSYIAAVNSLSDSLVFDQIAFPNVVGDTMIERFLTPYEDILSSMKFINPFFRLTESDISELDFAVTVYIDFYKAYFYISKIPNFIGSHRSTKVELVKIGGASGDIIDVAIENLIDSDLEDLIDSDLEILIDG